MDIDDTLRLIANPSKLKYKKVVQNKNDFLKYYLNNKFKTDIKTINNLIIHVDNFINNIDIDQIIIESVIQETIQKVVNENNY